MSLEDFSLYFVLGTFFGLAALDVLRPARQFERVRFWRSKGVAFFALYLLVSSLAPLAWDGLLAEYRVFDAISLGLGWQIGLAILAVEIGVYAWHRAMHNVNFLWRWFHQMHHSAERIDIWSSMVFHPLDMIGFTLVGSLGLVWLVGVSAPAAIVANMAIFFLATIQHANIKTPRWLGYFIARPEMHGLHHERGVHRYNYCDLPVIDMLLGTYKNPETWHAPAGFYSGGSSRLFDMLIGRDIDPPKELPAQPSAPASDVVAPSRRAA